MAVTINASTTTGLVQSADTSGIIELQNNGTTKLTVNSSGATIPTAIVTTLSDGTNSTSATNAIQGSAKAWVNFNGTNGSIRASYNVSSVTRSNTGVYSVAFTNALADANYCATTAVSTTSAPAGCFVEMFTNGSQVATAPTTSSFSMAVLQYNAAAFLDPVYVNVSVFD